MTLRTSALLGALLLSACNSSGDKERCVDFEVGGLKCPCTSTADCAGLVCGADKTCENADPRCSPLGATDCACGSDAECFPGLTCASGACKRADCATDGDCGTGRLCVRGSCYTYECRAASDCPTGQDCVDLHCTPRECLLSPGASGCYTGPTGTAKAGVCDYGLWQCLHDGMPVCAGQTLPATEACDGLDNDCDGGTDEDDTCMTPSSCVPAPERCNALDDDCDGQTDEGLGTVSCGVGVCQRTVSRCRDGMESIECTIGAPQPVACNGLDDDCDGAVDEADEGCSCADGATQGCYSGNPPETEGTGTCHGGVQRCAAGAWGACTGDVTPVASDVCDGRDEDCNGRVDDGLGQVECGVGACRRVVSSCTGGREVTCTPGAPAAETCDGVDNDCDGVVDCGAGLVCTASGCQSPLCGRACAFEWASQADLRVNATSDTAGPGITLDGGGAPIVVWGQSSSTLAAARSASGAPFQALTPPSTNAYFFGAHHVVSGGGSTLYALWDATNGGSHVLFASSSDGGAHWTTPVRVDSVSDNARDGALAFSNGVLYASWSGLERDCSTTPSCYDVYLSRSTDGGVTWQPPQRLNRDGAQDDATSVSADGSVVVVAWATLPRDIMVAASTDGGRSFGAAQRVNDVAGKAYTGHQPFVGVRGQRVHVVWSDERTDTSGDVYMDTSSDGGATWGVDAPVSDVTRGRQESATLHLAANGVVWVAWQDHRDNQFDIFVAGSTDGTCFCGSARLNHDAAEDQMNPTLVVDDVGRVHSAWRDDRGGGDFDIYYNRAELTAP